MKNTELGSLPLPWRRRSCFCSVQDDATQLRVSAAQIGANLLTSGDTHRLTP